MIDEKILKYKYKSVNKTLDNISIEEGGKLLVVEENFEGKLKELLIIAPTGKTGFSIMITADNKNVLKETYTNLNAYYHSYSEDILAADDTTYVYIAVRDLYFKKKLKIEIIDITQTGGITFNRIVSKIYKRGSKWRNIEQDTPKRKEQA